MIMPNGEGYYYYNFWTGRVYTEAFPTFIEEFYPERHGKVVAYLTHTISEGDPGYEDALERYLFFKGVRAYDEIPEWAVD